MIHFHCGGFTMSQTSFNLLPGELPSTHLQLAGLGLLRPCSLGGLSGSACPVGKTPPPCVNTACDKCVKPSCRCWCWDLLGQPLVFLFWCYHPCSHFPVLHPLPHVSLPRVPLQLSVASGPAAPMPYFGHISLSQPLHTHLDTMWAFALWPKGAAASYLTQTSEAKPISTW